MKNIWFIVVLVVIVVIAIVVMGIAWGGKVDDELLAATPGQPGTDFFECGIRNVMVSNSEVVQGKCDTTNSSEVSYCGLAGLNIPCDIDPNAEGKWTEISQADPRLFQQIEADPDLLLTGDERRYIITKQDIKTQGIGTTILYQQSFDLEGEWEIFNSLSSFELKADSGSSTDNGVTTTWKAGDIFLNGVNRGQLSNRSRGIAVKSPNKLVQFRIYKNGQCAIVKKITSDNKDLIHRGNYAFKHGSSTHQISSNWTGVSTEVRDGLDKTDVWQLAWCPKVMIANLTSLSFTTDAVGYKILRLPQADNLVTPQIIAQTENMIPIPADGDFIIGDDGIPSIRTVYTLSSGVSKTSVNAIGYFTPVSYNDNFGNNTRIQYPGIVRDTLNVMTGGGKFFHLLGATNATKTSSTEWNYAYIADSWIDPPKNHPNTTYWTAFDVPQEYEYDRVSNRPNKSYYPYLIVGAENAAVPDNIHVKAWKNIGDGIAYRGENSYNPGSPDYLGITTDSLRPGEYLQPTVSLIPQDGRKAWDGGLTVTQTQGQSTGNTDPRRWFFRMYQYGFVSTWYWENWPYYPQQLTLQGTSISTDVRIFDATPRMTQTSQCTLAFYSDNPSFPNVANFCQPTTWDTGSHQRAFDGDSFSSEFAELVNPSAKANFTDTRVPVLSMIQLWDGIPYMVRVAGKNCCTNSGFWQRAAGRYDSDFLDVNFSEYGSENAPLQANPIGREHSFPLARTLHFDGFIQFSYWNANGGTEVYTYGRQGTYRNYANYRWAGDIIADAPSVIGRELFDAHENRFPIFYAR